MTPEDLKAWRAQMGLNQRDAAAASERGRRFLAAVDAAEGRRAAR